MRFAAAISTADGVAAIGEELVAAMRGVAQPDLAVLFFTAALSDEAPALARRLRATLNPRVLLGVSCEGVIGEGQEIERAPAASLLAGTLPGVVLRPFHIGAGEWSEVLNDDERLQQRLGTGEEHRAQLLLGDPFTTPVDTLLPRLDELFGTPTFGGMASGGFSPGGNVLILDDAVYRDGAIGVGIGGPVQVDFVVSQGCRPVGEPMVVTRVADDMIAELGRKPALEAAHTILAGLSEADRALLENGLFMGVVINEYQERFGRGDFLVRGVMGVHQPTGAIAIGDHVRPGQTVQFHVRDAGTAHEDLAELLSGRAEQAPAGALLFSCNGRGTRMFPEPHHDARTTLEALPGIPLAGFFAMGELGPVGGKSFIHGHTASLALFRPAPEA
jgi:small ligand-binding sensory domain FIST